ncbi:hypothetical protein TNCV_4965731 [Trichonephila clavipes]|nr:hypothetical protein TNCV_4965731 [Trichonephila clavipes]
MVMATSGIVSVESGVQALVPLKIRGHSSHGNELMISVVESRDVLRLFEALGSYEKTFQDALFICYEQSPDKAHSVAFSQRSSSLRLMEDETFNDSDIINNLIDYERGQEARFFESG